jgi:hypothetical protein
VKIVSLHLNTASLSAGAGCYLKVEIESDSVGIFQDRVIIAVAAHLVSPRLRHTFLIYDFDLRGARLWRAQDAGHLRRRSDSGRCCHLLKNEA